MATRILHYVGTLEQGGSQAMLLNLYQHIDRERIQFDFVIHTVCATPLVPQLTAMGARIYICPPPRGNTAIAYIRWWDIFFTNHPEYRVVHCHAHATAAMVLGIAKQHGCVTISHSHSTSSGSDVAALVKTILQYPIRYVADYFMGCSQAAGEWLFGKKACTSSRYLSISNAIDSQSYVYNQEIATATRQALGYCDDDFIIGHVGRFAPPKNHRFLLKIFREVYKRNQRCKLLLVGDGKLKPAMEATCRRYGIAEAVTFTGSRTDVNHLMMAMDVFLFPSLYEGLPVSLIEAQATGCPCLTSTEVTQEVAITDLVESLSLKCGCLFWAENILTRKKAPRRNMSSHIARAGYDINTSAARMQGLYTRLSTLADSWHTPSMDTAHPTN